MLPNSYHDLRPQPNNFLYQGGDSFASGVAINARLTGDAGVGVVGAATA